MIGRRGVSDAAAARICSPTHFDPPYTPQAAASHVPTGPSEAAGPAAPSFSEVDLRELPWSASVELMNKRRGGTGRRLERAKSTRLRSMRKLPSKMLRGRWSSYVDSHALCTMWVTDERSCKRTVSLPRHTFRHQLKVPARIVLGVHQDGFDSRLPRGKSTLDDEL